MSALPEIAVVVATHRRALRLRWLLNSLEEQTLDPKRWELVVAHDGRDPETGRLLATHPLAERGTLRALASPQWTGPSAKRNAAWRAARAPVVAFTDDDCRAPADWLERALEAARAHPGAIVQGRTTPDPDEEHIWARAPHGRSVLVEPPVDWAQTCNILYPRAALEAVGGFDEDLPGPAGEDTDLAMRCRARGVAYVPAPAMLTHHCVEDGWLGDALRRAWRWQGEAGMVARHPRLRRDMTLRVFWKPSHATMVLALVGLAVGAARGERRWALLGLAWAHATLPSYGASPRGRLRALSELPARAAIDLVEMAAVTRGSLRYGSLLL